MPYNRGREERADKYLMGIALAKPWRPLSEIGSLPGQLGVFELCDDNEQVLLVGAAGGRSLFGLRSAVAEAAAEVPQASGFRVEVTTAYLTRYRELLMGHVAAHGHLPPANPPEPGLGPVTWRHGSCMPTESICLHEPDWRYSICWISLKIGKSKCDRCYNSGTCQTVM